MSLALFHTPRITPLTPTLKPSSSSRKPLIPTTVNLKFPDLRPTTLKLGNKICFTVKAASFSHVIDNNNGGGDLQEKCFVGLDGFVSSSYDSGPVMKGKFGSSSAVTLEKSKLDTSTTQKQKQSSPELATGGGNGNMGKIGSLGGGDGGDDGGDDDDYFDNFDEGDEGDDDWLFRRRTLLEALFGKKFVDAVLNEWQKTMKDLPAGLRQLYEMGLVSSAEMVKYLSGNARPTTERFISRCLPEGLSRSFIGRMIADPAFLHRLLLEQATTIGCSVWWEIKNRKERIKQEWDLALINVLTVTACNAIVVCSLASSRSYGKTFRFDLQNTLQKLPNNIFENSYPHRVFDLQMRLQSFFCKAAQLSMVGCTTGAAQSALSNLVSRKKEGRLSVTIPSASNNALGYGAFLGLYANIRYQLLCGFDRMLTNHFDVIGVPLFFSAALRVLNVQLGETSRLAWLGVEADTLAQSDDLLKAYSRPTEGVNQSSSSKWFISKNPIVSGLSRLGRMRRGQTDSKVEGEAPPPKARRKRVVKRRVATS